MISPLRGRKKNHFWKGRGVNIVFGQKYRPLGKRRTVVKDGITKLDLPGSGI
jgi:hypothetical protein